MNRRFSSSRSILIVLETKPLLLKFLIYFVVDESSTNAELA